MYYLGLILIITSDVCVLVAQSCLTLSDPMDCSLPVSSVLVIFQARILEWVTLLSRGSSPPGIEPRSPALQMDSLLTESPGKLSHSIDMGQMLHDFFNLSHLLLVFCLQSIFYLYVVIFNRLFCSFLSINIILNICICH